MLQTKKIVNGTGTVRPTPPDRTASKNLHNVVTFPSPHQKPKMESQLCIPFPPVSSEVFLPLTQVNHERNKAPADGKLAALEELLQPLLGLFAQLHHGDGSRGSERTHTSSQRVPNGGGRGAQAPNTAFTARVVSVSSRGRNFSPWTCLASLWHRPLKAHA